MERKINSLKQFQWNNDTKVFWTVGENWGQTVLIDPEVIRRVAAFVWKYVVMASNTKIFQIMDWKGAKNSTSANFLFSYFETYKVCINNRMHLNIQKNIMFTYIPIECLKFYWLLSWILIYFPIFKCYIQLYFHTLFVCCIGPSMKEMVSKFDK